ncbi:hypothetical protein GCM10010277_49900 [Streptomyces longisporoflavus]|uniref:hypothetical protein n=1 Tax=Streptomyces longisporoflavus TaxID=28044 RepID=UPI00167D7987|nr:hypothetical protein [Streptomyces longisporoflavus]GGV52835.1 hypothetical protein GCM10010277_49900 [Streptomyces longisporoflavus]
MSDIADTVHESYAFACMRCGHGWEQSYEIEHHTDGEGKEFVMYRADGLHVPSPLSRPTCLNCDGHVVRIMRAGQVSSVLDLMQRHHAPRGATKAASAPAGDSGVPEARLPEAREPGQHHWHLSALLHPFQHRKAG